MGTKKFTQFNSDTGEVVDGFIAVVQPKKKSRFERHFTMNQEALGILSKELNGEEFKVLFQLLRELDYENLIQVRQIDISKELEIDKSQVSRSIKRLVKLEVILEGPRIGNSKTYRLNPTFGWKGTVSNHNEALRKRMKEIGMKVVDKDD